MVINNKEDLKKCSKYILPGVGSFANGVLRMKKLNLFNSLKTEVIRNQKPFLGICFGMQLLFESSEESIGYEGLGFIAGKVVKLKENINYKIPRIGWSESKLIFDFLGLQKDKIFDFYYVHSYHSKPKDSKVIMMKSDLNVVSAVHYKNIYGCQFHPEKSHIVGLSLLTEFSKL